MGKQMEFRLSEDEKKMTEDTMICDFIRLKVGTHGETSLHD